MGLFLLNLPCADKDDTVESRKYHSLGAVESMLLSECTVLDAPPEEPLSCPYTPEPEPEPELELDSEVKLDMLDHDISAWGLEDAIGTAVCTPLPRADVVQGLQSGPPAP